ncbi:MAG: aspartate kinase [Candidatus Krumholzibacteriia bacterium]
MKNLIVQKYGGSSLDSAARIRSVAEKISARARAETRIIATVSAMGSSTDDLIQLAREITPNPPRRELDMLLTVGERTSMALLSMALNTIGCAAISFTGSQSGIVTNFSHTRALIEEIRADRIRRELGRGRVVIVAGFQGVSRDKEITTLGRGGSDTTAVALAAALGAGRCEIYSDYAGVFTADPRIVPSARPIPQLGYDAMLELAMLGARVLHYRAADIARRYRVPLRLSSSFEDSEGTCVPEDASMESAKATSVTCNRHVRWVHLGGEEATLADFSQRIGATDIQIMAYDKARPGGRTELTLIVDERDADMLAAAIEAVPGLSAETRDDLATVSVVGDGFAGSAATVARFERVLSDAGIAVTVVKSAARSVTAAVPAGDCRRAVEALHAAFVEPG